MPTLRRILKYAPAVVLGLLVGAWVVGCTVPRAVDSGRGEIYLFRGSIGGIVTLEDPPFLPPPTYLFEPGFGVGGFHLRRIGRYEFAFDFPIPLAITAILPLAIGPFISFRFRLWHYLAYTALIAVELAYYLRWQE